MDILVPTALIIFACWLIGTFLAKVLFKDEVKEIKKTAKEEWEAMSNKEREEAIETYFKFFKDDK